MSAALHTHAIFKPGAGVLDRLVANGFPVVDAAGITAAVSAPTLTALFVTGDPDKQLDVADIAVILPELIRHYRGRLTAALVARSAEPLMLQEYGVDVRPALAFFAGGRHLGTVTRVRDWDDYLLKIDGFLKGSAPQTLS